VLSDLFNLWDAFESTWVAILFVAFIVGLPIAIVKGIIAQRRENQQRAEVQEMLERGRLGLERRRAEEAQARAREDEARAEEAQARAREDEARAEEEQARAREDEARAEEAREAWRIELKEHGEAEQKKRLRLQEVKAQHVESGSTISEADQADFDFYEARADPILTPVEMAELGNPIPLFRQAAAAAKLLPAPESLECAVCEAQQNWSKEHSVKFPWGYHMQLTWMVRRLNGGAQTTIAEPRHLVPPFVGLMSSVREGDSRALGAQLARDIEVDSDADGGGLLRLTAHMEYYGWSAEFHWSLLSLARQLGWAATLHSWTNLFNSTTQLAPSESDLG
jgi:hypothetical protein